MHGKRGRRLGDWVEKVKRFNKLVVTKRHGNTKYSIGNIVNNIVITMYGARWVLEISGGTLCKVYDCLTIMWYT